MNLDNVTFMQPVRGTFWGVFISSFALCVIAAVVILAAFSHYHILPSHAHMMLDTYGGGGGAGKRTGSMDMFSSRQRKASLDGGKAGGGGGGQPNTPTKRR